MAAREALALCRELVMVAPDPVLYAQRFEQVLDDLEQVIGPVEPAGLGVAFCDVEALGREVKSEELRVKSGVPGASLFTLHSSLLTPGEIILRAVPPVFRARLGVAQGKFVAEAAARQAQPGQVSIVPAGQEQAFLAPLSAGLLPVTPDLARGFQQQGLHTLGSLSGLPLGPVQAQFGAAGGRAWRLARGQDDRPFQPRARALKAEARLRFPAAVASSQGLLAGLERLLVRAFSLPVTRGRSVEQITLRAWGEARGERRETRGEGREARGERLDGVLASRLSPLASDLSPLASRLSPLASRT
jgi:nucleotidyltransferase/DNA polymerase involved in DNA repair